MQYTASSYTQPLSRVFQGLLATEVKVHSPSGYWPASSGYLSRTPDPVLDRTLTPGLSAADRGLGLVRRIQHGRLQYYLLYVLVFLVLVLIWKL
jgi:hypothetical protein